MLSKAESVWVLVQFHLCVVCMSMDGCLWVFFAHTFYIYVCFQDRVLTLKPQWSQIREGGLGFRAIVLQFQPLLP